MEKAKENMKLDNRAELEINDKEINDNDDLLLPTTDSRQNVAFWASWVSKNISQFLQSFTNVKYFVNMYEWFVKWGLSELFEAIMEVLWACRIFYRTLKMQVSCVIFKHSVFILIFSGLTTPRCCADSIEWFENNASNPNLEPCPLPSVYALLSRHDSDDNAQVQFVDCNRWNGTAHR